MSITTRKNTSVKALQAFLAAEKKINTQALLEWEIACNTNNQRGHVYDQHEILKLYSRYGENSLGATKAVHLHDHNGNSFQTIVIKRFQHGGYVPDAAAEHDDCTGNQLIDEINCWVKFAEKPEADFLCPILKFFKSKSDKVTATSKTMLNNVVIIAQKAVYVSDLKSACRKAEKLNAEHGYTSENAIDRFQTMCDFAKTQGWRDAIWNGGNSGVIFDYAKGCYKAVFIDYAL